MKEWKWKALPPTQSATVIPLRPHLWNIGKYANHDGNSNEIAPDKSWCGQDPLLGTIDHVSGPCSPCGRMKLDDPDGRLYSDEPWQREFLGLTCSQGPHAQ